MWDALLALGMELVVGFALLQPPPDEPPAALGYALGTTDSVDARWRSAAWLLRSCGPLRVQADVT